MIFFFSFSYTNSGLLLQNDIDTIESRAESWGLSFAANKCCRLRFIRGFRNVPEPYPLVLKDVPLPCTSSCRDLGIEIDCTLNFHKHIAAVANRASGLCSTLLRGTLCRSQFFMREIFISHVRPLLEFCSPLWNLGYIGDLELLESIQRGWIRHISGFEGLSYYDRLQRLTVFSVGSTSQSRFNHGMVNTEWPHTITCGVSSTSK